MMLAVPAPHRGFLRTDSAEELAATLDEVSARVPVDRMRRAHRGPRKPRDTPKSPHRHRSTKRRLDPEREKRPP